MLTLKKTIALLFLLLCAVPAFGAAETTVNKIAAVVNGEIITLHDLRLRTANELGRRGISPNDPRASEVMNMALESMINDILLRHEAERFKITVSDREVEDELNSIIQRNRMSAKDFEAQLKRQGGTMNLMRENIRNNMLRQRMITYMISRKVIVTAGEVRQYYDSHPQEFSNILMTDFSVIVFGPGVDHKALHQALVSGQLDFNEAAKLYSMDKGGAEGAGRLRRVPWTSLPEELRNILSSLEVGQISPIFTFEGRETVVRLDQAPTEVTLSFEEVSPRIEEMLREPRMQDRFQEYSSQLRSKAVVDIRL